MSWTYIEFETLFEKAKRLRKEDFLTQELLMEIEGKDYIGYDLDKKFKNYMFELLEGDGVNIKDIFYLKDRFKIQYWWNGNKQDDLNNLNHG